MLKTSNTFGKPHQDASWGAAPTGDGAVQLLGYEYSSVVVAIWQAKDIPSMEYFLNRFILTLDTWYDAFEPGWEFTARITHRKGEDIGGDTTSDLVSFKFLGWVAEQHVPEGGESAVDPRYIRSDVYEAANEANSL